MIEPIFQNILIFIFSVAITIVISNLFFKKKSKKLCDTNIETNIKLSRAIRELKIARITTENIIENSSSVVISCNVDGRIITWNSRAEEMFGFSKKDILLKKIEILNNKNDSWKFDDIFNDVKINKQKKQLAFKSLRKDGNTLELIVTITPINDKDGKLISINFSIEDVSERNKLLELYTNREKMLTGITSLNVVLSSMAHYLINCVSAISTTGQLAEIDKQYLEKFLEVTMYQVKKMIETLNGLNDFNGKIKVKTREFVAGKETLFSIEREIKEFMSLFDRRDKSEINIQKYTFHPDDK